MLPSQPRTLLSDPDIIDLVSVGDELFAITTAPRTISGCTTVPVQHLSSRLKDFIARGYSHRYRQPYAAVAGVFPWIVITYRLDALPPSRKQVFSHALDGIAISRSGHSDTKARAKTGTPINAPRNTPKAPINAPRNTQTNSSNPSKSFIRTGLRTGLLASWRGEKLGRGAFIIPASQETDALTFLHHWNVPYTREVILRER